jgi:hypothetical protein
MFLNKLIELSKGNHFSLEVTTKDQEAIITVLPKHQVPVDSKGAVAQLHAALTMPLRIRHPINDDLDSGVIANIVTFIEQRHVAQSTLNDVVKSLAEASKAAKQEAKSKLPKPDKPATSQSANVDDESSDNNEAESEADETDTVANDASDNATPANRKQHTFDI